METNALPNYDSSDSPTGCCPRFNPQGWDAIDLHFENKLFLKAETRAVFHIPTNMAAVFAKTFADIEAVGAQSDDDCIVMSRDSSNWKSEHLFAVTKEVPGHEMVRLSGDYLTKTFEGPFRDMRKWEKDMDQFVKSRGFRTLKSYYFYTTCPKCAKAYGKNYVVAVSEVEPELVAA